MPPVHFHFPGLLLDWSQNQCVLYERAPLWGESFVPDSLQGTTYDFEGRRPRLATYDRRSPFLEAYLPDQPAVGEEQPRP